MKDKEFEKELFQSLDSICANELEGLQETVELTAQHMTLDDSTKARISSKALGKAGITMSDNKHENRINLSKKKRISVIAAFAAAAAITVTAGAVTISNYKQANHEEAVHSAVNEDLESKDYYIGKAKQADNGHLKLTNESVLFDGENGVIILTIEPTDEIGEDIVNSSQYIEFPFQIFDKDGYFKGYTDGTSGCKLTNGCLVEYYAFTTTELTDEKLTAKGKLNAVITSEDEINGEGQDISDISFEFEKNCEPVTLKSEKGVVMHLSDYLLYIEHNDTEKEPYIISSDITVTYKDGTTDIIKNCEYKNDSLVLNDFAADTGRCNTKKYGDATIQYFLKLIESKNVESVSFDGQTFTVEQS